MPDLASDLAGDAAAPAPAAPVLEVPESLGALAWLDASTGHSAGDGDDVETWTDRIGGYAFTNATVSEQPDYNATGSAGIPSMSFLRSASQHLRCTDSDITDAFAAKAATVYVLGRNTWLAGYTVTGFSVGDNATTQGGAVTYDFTVATAWTRGASSYVYASVVGSSSIDTDYWLRYWQDGDSLGASRNGQPEVLNATAAGALTTLDHATVGARADNGAVGDCWDGEIYDVIIFDSALSAGDAATLEAWAETRLGL